MKLHIFLLSYVSQRECISVHVGQAGVQIGNACWELYCLEHGILNREIINLLYVVHQGISRVCSGRATILVRAYGFEPVHNIRGE